MKKLAAILLLTLFVFNTVGYRFLFDMLESSTDAAFTAKLDNGRYNKEDLITIKVPINMPYQVNRAGFERVDGEINVNGQVYRYVMREVQSDTMTLLCIPHYEKTALQNKASEFAGKVNDLPSNDNNKKAEVFKQLTVDFDINENAASLSSINVQAVTNLYRNTILSQQFLPVNGQPPEVMA
ncbi:hypothetical protein FRZ67_14045 [Panacibacter ginsenosidivorans]|uniref:Uncharacterized protein n=1 Tax=Panacibacter ginsenosidivorans TaxID=1813871 RepID=A0A5B8VDL4_9BACT|nr:hypothetical protein [Panacibacter ginsenosidivorans]QEC68368.1 hypothetical protein FRZ67_14045 [Panacibacter ginsenosidivorans]